jgi:hypothetical protein
VPPGPVALLCLWPHDRQIAPTCLISVSFDISFSRTAVEPEITGPLHLLHECRDMKVLSSHRRSYTGATALARILFCVILVLRLQYIWSKLLSLPAQVASGAVTTFGRILEEPSCMDIQF